MILSKKELFVYDTIVTSKLEKYVHYKNVLTSSIIFYVIHTKLLSRSEKKTY